MSSWWDTATTEERLAQIDGGIECGMIARQIAKNLRMEGRWETVRVFANRKGRYFYGDISVEGMQAKRAAWMRLARRNGACEESLEESFKDAFSIFPAASQEHLFEPSYDEVVG